MAVVGVDDVLTGMISFVFCRDVLSSIDLSQKNQFSRLCESLGTVLQIMLRPPCIIIDINKDFHEASLCLTAAIDNESKAYWRLVMRKLGNELENAGN